jgi:hypothetical protein
MYHKRRTSLGFLLSGLVTLWTSAGTAAPPERAAGSCVKSSQQAREHVQAGRLRRAREAFTLCAKSGCGGVVSQQCRSGLQQLDVDTPSVVPVATDRTGAQRVDVGVSMDGELLTPRIDGRSLDVDPGMHEFSFRSERGEVHSEKILILQGQRNRIISVELNGSAAVPSSSEGAPPPVPAGQTPPASGGSADVPSGERAQPLAPAHGARAVPASAPADVPRASPVLAYVVGGAGLAAVGSSLLLAHWGREDNILLERCAPNCSQQSVDHVRRLYIAADITLGAGVLAIGAATWLYLSRPDIEDSPRAQAYRFDVRPLASGAFATVGRAF